MALSNSSRYGAAFAAGAIAYGATLYQFLTYSERNNLGPAHWLALAALTLVIGYLATFGVKSSRFRVVHCMLAGIFVAHMLVIAIDVREDPTNHNLLPFEFVIIGFFALPGYLGAKIAQWMDRSKQAG